MDRIYYHDGGIHLHVGGAVGGEHLADSQRMTFPP